MDKSGIFVGGVIGSLMVTLIFVTLFVLPPESIKNEIIVNDNQISNSIVETTRLYSNNLSLIEIFEKSEPGVVRVNVQRSETSDVVNGVGSGFVFDKKGHVITNAHVVKDAKKVVVTFLDGRSYNAKIIGIDEFTDMAVLKVNADFSTFTSIVNWRFI